MKINDVLSIDFIFDTGASESQISPDVALTLIRTKTIEESDWLDSKIYTFADGSQAKSSRFKIKKIQIGKKVYYDIPVSISQSVSAPLLLGQNVLQKIGKITQDNHNKCIILEY